MSEQCSLCTAGSLSEEHLIHLLREQNRQLELDSKARTFLRQESENSIKNEDELAEELAVAWLDVMKRWDGSARKKLKTQVNQLIDKGVPNDLRALIWMVLANDSNKSHLRLKYPELIEQSSPCEKLIRRDITRTYPENKFFKKQGQEALFNVIKAYSLHDREVGYCQGSPFIVGILLLQMPEEEAFCVMVELMENYRLREFFKPSMSELSLHLYILSELIQEHVPEIHTHFKAQGFHPTTYASQWFLTLFATVLPLNAVFRIMDIFLWEQSFDIIFQVGIALLKEGKDVMINQDIEGMLQYFRTTVYKNYVGAEDELIRVARQVKLDQKKLKRIRHTYTSEKEKESAELEECKRLAFENSVLCQRIRTLEEETCHLADKLIKGQVMRAEQAEEMFIVKRELVALRRHDSEVNERLKETTRRASYLDAKLQNICNENETLRRALCSLGLDPMEYIQNIELPNCVYSTDVKLPELQSHSQREEKCDVGYCTLERQESTECSAGAMQMLSESTEVTSDVVWRMGQTSQMRNVNNDNNRNHDKVTSQPASPAPSSVDSGTHTISTTGGVNTHTRSISSDSVASNTSTEPPISNINSYYKSSIQVDSKLTLSHNGTNSANSNSFANSLKTTFSLPGGNIAGERVL